MRTAPPTPRAITMLGTAVRRISSVFTGHAARYDWKIQNAKVVHLFYYQKGNEFTSAILGTRCRNIHTGDRIMYGTTVLCVRKSGRVVILADGQVTMGSEIIKPNVRKVRRIGDTVIGGFAGATADAFTLFERLESKLEEHPGQLIKAAVELAKAWRTDKFLRRLDAVMVVADADTSLTITGTGDVLEPYDGVIGIGSGGPYASAAARALIDLPDMDAEQIARKAMKIAADSCIYTNHNFTMESIGPVCNAENNTTAAVSELPIEIHPTNTNGDGPPPK